MKHLVEVFFGSVVRKIRVSGGRRHGQLLSNKQPAEAERDRDKEIDREREREKKKESECCACLANVPICECLLVLTVMNP